MGLARTLCNSKLHYCCCITLGIRHGCDPLSFVLRTHRTVLIQVCRSTLPGVLRVLVCDGCNHVCSYIHNWCTRLRLLTPVLCFSQHQIVLVSLKG
jgi:hypothetical protein